MYDIFVQKCFLKKKIFTKILIGLPSNIVCILQKC
jgi:hypothetical protein